MLSSVTSLIACTGRYWPGTGECDFIGLFEIRMKIKIKKKQRNWLFESDQWLEVLCGIPSMWLINIESKSMAFETKLLYSRKEVSTSLSIIKSTRDNLSQIKDDIAAHALSGWRWHWCWTLNRQWEDLADAFRWEPLLKKCLIVASRVWGDMVPSR